MKIDNYQFGKLQIGTKTYTRDLVLFPDHIQENWIRQTGHLLRETDIPEVLQEKPELVVIGTGKFGLMKVPEKVREKLTKENIDYIVAPTAVAVQRYNQLQTQNKVGLFHLTC